MSLPTFTKLPPDPSFSDLAAKVNTLVNEMTNLLLSLDSINVVSLTADHVDTGTLDAGKVTVKSDLNAGAYILIDGSGLTINNGAVDVLKADIDGHVVMTSAVIQSSTGYPKVVMDPTGQLFAAHTTVDTYVGITPDYLGNGPGQIAVRGGITEGGTYATSGKHHIAAVGGLKFEAGEDIEFSTGGISGVKFESWGRVQSDGDSQSLQDALDEKANVSACGSNLVYNSTSKLLKLFAADGTLLSTVNLT